MASGTPVLTTALPGIPSEYLKHVYVFESENLNGYKNTLLRVLNKDKNELHLTGIRAKEFVIRSKTNSAQAKKIIKWIENI